MWQILHIGSYLSFVAILKGYYPYFIDDVTEIERGYMSSHIMH